MDDEINLLDYWRVLMRRKKLIACVVGCATLIAIIYSLLASKTYKAEATLLPIGGEQGMGMAALIAQTELGGFLGGLGQSDASPSIMAALKSRTIAEEIVQRFSLMKVFYHDRWNEETGAWKVKDPRNIPQMEDAVKKLHGAVIFVEDKKSSLIKIAGEFRDPELAANVVNGYIEELADFLVQNQLTAAKRNRIFIEEQLEKNKVSLLETGKELSQFYGNNQISNRDPRLDVNVALNNISVEPLLQFNGEKDISKLEKEKAHLEKQIQKTRLVKDVPQQIYLEYTTAYYQLLGQMSALLTQQYEMAKIDEAKEDISFQVIDWARVPVRRFKPKRSLIVIASFAFSVFSAVFISFFLEYLQRMKEAERVAQSNKEAVET